MNRAQTLPAPAVRSASFRFAQWRMLLAAMFCYLFFYTGRQTFASPSRESRPSSA